MRILLGSIVFFLGLSLAKAGAPTSFGGATRMKSIEKGKATADAGNLLFWFTPATKVSAGGTITLTADQDVGSGAVNTVCTVKANDGETDIALATDVAQTKWNSKTELLITIKDTEIVANKVVMVNCPHAQLEPNHATKNTAYGFQVKTSADTTDTTKKTGYTTADAKSVSWTSGLVDTLCATSVPANLVVKFTPTTEIADTGTIKLTSKAASIFTADAATACTVATTNPKTGASGAVDVNAAATASVGAALTITKKTGGLDFVTGQEVTVTCTTNLKANQAKDTAVTFDIETSGDDTPLTGQTGYTNTAACIVFGGATRMKSIEKGKTAADAGNLLFWFTPATEVPAGGTITLTADQDVASGVANTVCTVKANDGATDIPLSDTPTATKWNSTRVLLITTKDTAIVANKVVMVNCPHAQLGANHATKNTAYGFQVKTSAETTDSVKKTGYTTADAKSVSWTSGLVDTLCATSVPANLVVKFTPTTEIADTGTIKLTSKAASIFTADAATACTVATTNPKTGASGAVDVNAAATASVGAALTITKKTGGLDFVTGQEVTVTCTTNLKANQADTTAVTFDIETSGDDTPLTGQTGYTNTAACAAPSSSSSSSSSSTAAASSSSSSTAAAAGNNTAASASAAASTSKSTVTQKYTFASLTASDYEGNTKGNMECAYTCTVENGAVGTCTWCVPKKTTPFRDYKSGIAITSSVARRAATVTFVLVVDSSIKSLDQIKTLVASNSDATKFAEALKTVNTGSNLTITDPGAATILPATFTSTASTASTLLPSMLAFVSALLVAFRE